ncbi:MAG: aminotransferase class I/II-fold pyridoxal phosphate-dependent enzyme [Epulopiscium sp.]|nr:aminotransferase class I/II-fold pyridoxal phosphate-dependent enzyme [Candidatus Epulonipiscium sp.]
MKRIDHTKTPLFTALKEHMNRDVIPFHVPGHKYGRGNPELLEFFGENTMKADLNGMEDLDNACNPISVIKEAEEYVADAFGAEEAFFLVNGTTSGIQAMIMSAVRPGEQIIIPRNAHKSTIGGIILAGAIPIYVPSEINEELGIAMGVSAGVIKKALEIHHFAKAVFVVNPTYYGAVSDLKSIVRSAHRNGTAVLVDEAHGAHMHFHDEFPLTAMEVGADMSACSTHKTGGSLTQSSVLLLRGNMIEKEVVKQVLNLNFTTSASYLLMASIDTSRKLMATQGEAMLTETLELCRYAREKLNEIEGVYAFGRELVGTPGCFDLDETKLGIHVRRLGITGFEMEKILRKEYNIQVEMSDIYNVMAIITMGDRKEDIDKLVDAVADIARKQGIHEVKNIVYMPDMPELIVSPRDAFYSPKRAIPLEESVGQISAEMIMAYPPGIPIICPGERITKDVIDYVKLLKEEECQMQGTADPYVNYIRVLGRSVGE